MVDFDRTGNECDVSSSGIGGGIGGGEVGGKDSGETVSGECLMVSYNRKGAFMGGFCITIYFPGSYRVTFEGPTPVHQLLHKRTDSATTLVAPEPVPAPPVPPPKGPVMIPEPPRRADIRRPSQIINLAHAMTNEDTCHARLKLDKEQALLTQIDAIKAQEEAYRV